VVESSSTGVLQPTRRQRPSLCNHLPCSHQSRMLGEPAAIPTSYPPSCILDLHQKHVNIPRYHLPCQTPGPERHPQAHASPRLNLSRRPSSSVVGRSKGRSSNHLLDKPHEILPAQSERSSASKTSGWQGGVPAKLSRSMCLINSVRDARCASATHCLTFHACTTPRPNPCSHP
jgi:hypothetical protein